MALSQSAINSLDPEEMDGLARSVARQWQRHEGHACLFVGGHQQLVTTLNENPDGTCQVASKRVAVDLEAALSTFGFPPEVLPQVIAGINLNQELDFRDRQGVRCRLWFDPKEGRVGVQPLDLAPPAAPTQTPPVLCPSCTAVLRPWQDGERQQTCAHCGHTVSLPGHPAVAPRTPPVVCPNCTAVLAPGGRGSGNRPARTAAVTSPSVDGPTFPSASGMPPPDGPPGASPPGRRRPLRTVRSPQLR
jgi:hypothetical protein